MPDNDTMRFIIWFVPILFGSITAIVLICSIMDHFLKGLKEKRRIKQLHHASHNPELLQAVMEVHRESEDDSQDG